MHPPTPGRPILTVPTGFSAGQHYWGTSVAHSIRGRRSGYDASGTPWLRQKAMLFLSAYQLAGGAISLHPIDGIGSEVALMAFLAPDRFLRAPDYIQTR